jgi:type IV pilus assembly protein PilO
MANLRQARRDLYVILAVFLVVDIAAAVVLLTPVAGSAVARQKEFDGIRRQVQAKMKLVIPPDQVQDRVEVARKQIASFYNDRVPSEGSEISTELGRLATANRVSLLAAKYMELDPDVPGLTRLRIDANIVGDYLQEVKFINSLERSKMFFVIDAVNLSGAAQPGNVRLSIALETYVKGGAQ